jgi:hypothetical protein
VQPVLVSDGSAEAGKLLRLNTGCNDHDFAPGTGLRPLVAQNSALETQKCSYINNLSA